MPHKVKRQYLSSWRFWFHQFFWLRGAGGYKEIVVNKPGVIFSKDQEGQIRALVEQGRLAEAQRHILDNLEVPLIAFGEVMRQFAEEAGPIIDEFARGIQVQAEIINRGLRDAGLFVTMTFDESVFRAYAARLNWRRRYRKISWRLLNRRQRLEAEAAVLHKHKAAR